MRIPVISVVTDEAGHLRDWLACIRRMNRHIVVPVPCVVDNGSSDETAGLLWSAIRQDQIDRNNVFWLPANRGFASAQNHALRQLGARNEHAYFATLNIDAEASSDWLENLVREARSSSSGVGMWGGRILQKWPLDNRVSSMGHALRARDGAFLDIDWNKPVDGDLDSNKPTFEPFCPCFAAALWSFEMVRDVGVPDNDQFLYYDDVDLAYKARLHGWSVRFVREAVAYHPLPNLKRTHDRQRLFQLEGRVLMACRYFPTPEREQVLATLTLAEREVLDGMPSKRKKQYGSEDMRKAVFQYWKNRYIPTRQC